MNLYRFLWLGLPLLTSIAPVMAQATTPTVGSTAEAEQFVIDVPGIMPEGVAYDAIEERFVFGSLTQGTIRLMSEDGTVTAFIEDHNLTSSVGLQIDTRHSRLLVADGDRVVFSDPAAAGKAGLGSYDRLTGDPLFYVDLAAVASDGRDFANDVAVDSDGNAYVTNSFTPVIYKVDLYGNAEVFARDERFSAAPVGLNGIVYSPDGYLLASVTGSESLFKIPLDDPTNVTQVAMGGSFGADGMALADDGILYAVANFSAADGTPSQAIVGLDSSDDWATARIVARDNTTGSATTLTLRGFDQPWYINAYIDDPQAQQYEIVKASWEAG